MRFPLSKMIQEISFSSLSNGCVASNGELGRTNRVGGETNHCELQVLQSSPARVGSKETQVLMTFYVF